MTTSVFSEPRNEDALQEALIQTQTEHAIDALMTSIPDLDMASSAEQRRGIIARYTAVLEGNFIYWMTGAYLSAQSESARSVILENLHEEVRDSHPAMLRRFNLAARAIPTETDVMAVHEELTKVRLFVGRLAGVRLILMMTFFEGFIQKFMSFLGRLAARRDRWNRNTPMCTASATSPTRGNFSARLRAEMELNPTEPAADLFEGVELLRALIVTIRLRG